MGFGLPQSIGVCLASGGKRTVCVVGDGGLQHNIQELETLKRLNIPVKLFVLNNNGYAAIRNTHNRFLTADSFAATLQAVLQFLIPVKSLLLMD